ETILEMIRDGKAGEVYDNASDIFKQQETRANFIRIHEDLRGTPGVPGPLGAYKRLLNVTEAKSIGGLTAFFDCVVEFEKSSGVRVIFNFARPSKTAKWQLRSLKVVVPMPRPDEGRSLVPPNPDVRADEPPLLREISPPLQPARPDAAAPDAGVAAPPPKPKRPAVPAIPSAGTAVGEATSAAPPPANPPLDRSRDGSAGSAT